MNRSHGSKYLSVFLNLHALPLMAMLVLLIQGLAGQTSPPTEATTLPNVQSNPSPVPSPVTTVVEFLKTPDRSRSREAETKTTRSALSDQDNWSLTIRTNPQNCTIYIDGKNRGSSPVSLENPANMNPSISVTCDGYKNYSTSFMLQKGFNLDFEITLAPKVGWLEFNANVPIQEVTVDGSKISLAAIPAEVPTGHHSIRVRSFSYQDFTADLNIDEDVLHTFSLQFAPEAFGLSALNSSKKRFRPGNQGNLGTDTFRFQVSAPGTASLLITDSKGIQVRHFDFPDFDTWSQEYTWDGKDDQGNLLPEGEYTCKISGLPRKLPVSKNTDLEATVAIDNSMFMKARAAGFGTSGPAHIMDTYILGEGGLSIGSTFSWLGKQGSLADSDSMALDVWLRASPIDRLELTAGIDAGMAIDNTTTVPTVFLYAGAKYQLVKPSIDGPHLSWATGLKGSGYINAVPLPYYREVNGQTAGVSLQNSFQLDVQPFLALVDVGLKMNVFASYSHLNEVWLVPAPTLGMALGLDNDTFHWTIGGKLEFLDFYDLFTGNIRVGNENILAAALGSWGMSAPPRISTQFMITSPWNLAFGLDMFCQLYPGAGFLDHPGISLTVIFME